MRHRLPSSRASLLMNLAVLLAAALLLLALACGRKGDPRPRSDVSADLSAPPAGTSATPGR